MSPYVAALVFVNANTSWPAWKLPVTETVADAAVVESPSAKVMPLSTATGVDAVLSPATNDVVPPVAVSTGGELTSAYTKLSRVGRNVPVPPTLRILIDVTLVKLAFTERSTLPL